LVIQGQERSEEVNEEQLRAYQDWPKPGSLRLIDFERTEIVTLESFPPQFVLRVAGTKPFLNMEVELVPLVFIQQPEYWGIEVVGHLRGGIGLPVVTSYDVSIPLMGITGTRGVEVIGATRSERIEIPPTAVPLTECRDWSAWHDHQPPGPPTLHVHGECLIRARVANHYPTHPFRTVSVRSSRKFGKNNALKGTEFIELSSLPVFIRQHSNQRGKEVTRYAKLEHKHFVGGYEALVYSVMAGATERKEHEYSFPHKGG
jgi:hypothetical protein